ncbi:hypothetical protein OH818_04180 [Jiella pelagia]|uniref:Uncharacterized protein n=1 Tax=Jiella pelagia TaxID=2986949 RepID=A0ABY7C0C2_9HYPH|nr:hypothetical protein [Jiella pelagia]WAP69468.1 hypothetical protein OH818_04180 [Jiella pelagia]
MAEMTFASAGPSYGLPGNAATWVTNRPPFERFKVVAMATLTQNLQGWCALSLLIHYLEPRQDIMPGGIEHHVGFNPGLRRASGFASDILMRSMNACAVGFARKQSLSLPRRSCPRAVPHHDVGAARRGNAQVP